MENGRRFVCPDIREEKIAGAELVQLWAWLLHKRQSCLRIMAPTRQVFMCLHGRAMCALFSLHGSHNMCAL